MPSTYQWLCTVMLSYSEHPIHISNDGVILSTQKAKYLVESTHIPILTLV